MAFSASAARIKVWACRCEMARERVIFVHPIVGAGAEVFDDLRCRWIAELQLGGCRRVWSLLLVRSLAVASNKNRKQEVFGEQDINTSENHVIVWGVSLIIKNII
ncbi:hypothetical protein [Mesorhizobium sp. M0060]|uniref:hypothetical protein n=1 Tax=Mesorhizobium sp. M0060 TaxID=2956866 RepID=UPI00333A7969